VLFTKGFGPAIPHRRKQNDNKLKEIFLVSNVEPEGLGHDLVPFHSDLSYMENPGLYSLLLAVQIPKTGGNTKWVNCAQAYDELDEDLKQQLKEKRAVHRHPVEHMNPSSVSPSHPIVRTHPDTGRKSLFVNVQFTRYIEGIDGEESAKILQRVLRHLTQEKYIYEHKWQLGDFLMWDNRFTMHQREHFDPKEIRLMKRTQILGDNPM